MAQRRDDLIEERLVPSGQLLGGKLLRSTDQGLVREVRVAFCETCRKHLQLDEVYLCSCGRKLCHSCMKYEYEGRRLCLFCLQMELPIRKTDLMLLEAIHAGIRSKAQISNLARLSNAETALAIQRMQHHGFLTSRGVSIFARPLLTNKGVTALKIYSAVYTDADLSEFRTCLSRLLGEER